MQKIKVVILDVGGTLISTNYKMLISYISHQLKKKTLVKPKKFEKRFFEIFKENFNEAREKKFRTIKYLLEESFIECLNVFNINKNFSRDIISNLYKKYIKEKEKINPTSIKILDYIKSRGIKLGVISNSDYMFLNLSLKKFKITKYFDFIITSDKLKVYKPNPLIFKKILSNFKLNPTEVIFVDDSEKNIVSAKSVGINTVLISPQKNTISEKISDYTISNLNEIKNIIP